MIFSAPSFSSLCFGGQLEQNSWLKWRQPKPLCCFSSVVYTPPTNQIWTQQHVIKCKVIHNEICLLLCHIFSWELNFHLNFHLKSWGQVQSCVWCLWYWHLRKLSRALLSVACYSKPSSALPCVSNSNHSTGHVPDITNPLQNTGVTVNACNFHFREMQKES